MADPVHSRGGLGQPEQRTKPRRHRRDDHRPGFHPRHDDVQVRRCPGHAGDLRDEHVVHGHHSAGQRCRRCQRQRDRTRDAVPGDDSHPYRQAFSYTTAVAPTGDEHRPDIGTATGGSVVTITGTGFDTTGATAVNVVPTGGTLGAANSATAVSCASSTLCTATSPAATAPSGLQLADVLVTVGGLTSTATPADVFTYDTAPIVTGLTPSTGTQSGGTSVTINGSGFDTSGNTTVHFGLVDIPV